jgi:alcohol dehydrogenase class IV
MIVTIGGGSSMDTAKAIGVIVENPEFADVRSPRGRRSTPRSTPPSPSPCPRRQAPRPRSRSTT